MTVTIENAVAGANARQGENPLKLKRDKDKFFFLRFAFCQIPVIFLRSFTDIFPHQEPHRL